MVVVIVLLFPLLALMVPEMAFAGPWREILIGVPGAGSGPAESARLILNIPTRQGVEHLVLQRRDDVPPPRITENGAASARAWSEAILFTGAARERGTARTSGRRRAVAADLIDGRLRVVFSGRRRGRLFTAVTRDLRTIRVGSMPRFKSLGCGVKGKDGPAEQGLRRIAPALLAATESPSPVYAPPRRIELSTEADFEFFQAFGVNTAAEIQATINRVETLYADQLGLTLELSNQNIFTSPADPYTTSDAEQLLSEFQSFTNSNGHLGAADLFHLFTGKDLSRGIVGLAFLSAICREEDSFSFGLSQIVPASLQSIVTAHEIGHNLGANHPEERFPAGVNLRDSLMTGIVDPTHTRFSDFSRGEIVSHVDQFGACLTLDAPSAALAVSSSLSGRFSARITPLTGDPTCRTTLYGAASRSSLLRGVRRGTLLIRRALPPGQSIRLTARIPGTGARRPFYLRAATVCSAEGTPRLQGSVIKRVTSREPRFLAKLRQSLN